MGNHPLISVIMPVYNGEKHLSEAIESILQQTYNDYEFIIINDGSNDRTGDIIDKYRKLTSCIRVFNQDNMGIVKSLNKGIELSRGKYIARMDADDISLSTRFEKQIQYLEKNTDVAVCGTANRIMGADGEIGRLPVVWPLSHRSVRKWLWARGSCMCHSSAMIRRKCLETVGVYRAAFYGAEDYDLWFRLSERYRVINLPYILLVYRFHENSICIRDSERQALADYCVRKAAVLRSRGLPDPLDDVKDLDDRVIKDLGITADEKRYIRSKAGIESAKRMLRGGGTLADAAKHVSTIESEYDGTDMEAEIKADVILMRTEMLSQQKSHYSALLYLMRMFVLVPTARVFLFKRITQRIQRLLRIAKSICRSIIPQYTPSL